MYLFYHDDIYWLVIGKIKSIFCHKCPEVIGNYSVFQMADVTI